MLTRTKHDSLINVPSHQQEEAIKRNKTAPTRVRAGMLCPSCNSARVDYNGLLKLMCARCGVLETGTFT